MKIRNGFVSNSSSSCFILAIGNGEDICPHCGRGTSDTLTILKYKMGLENWHDNRILAEGEREILDYVEENWFDDDKSTIEKFLQQAGDRLVVMVEISRDDEELNDFIYDSNQIEIINKEVW